VDSLRKFLLFWFDFIVGDDWLIAAGVVIALVAASQLALHGLKAWWLMPVATVTLLAMSIWREARRSQ
jgi:hypothetical protein